MGSLRVKIKLTVTVRPGSKVKYNEGKYKLTNYIDGDVERVIGLNKQNNCSAGASIFYVHFFAVPARL